jgi:hypothetical protein
MGRIAQRTARDQVISAVDPEARHIHKNRARHQDGFKGHVSFEPETGLFTAVALTGGSGAGNHEAAIAPGLLAGEQEELTIPGDAAYGTGELRQRLQADGHAMVIISAAAGHPWGLHHRRLHYRRPGWHRHLPGRAHRSPGPPPCRRQPPGPVQSGLPRLPVTRALHHLQDRARP